MKVLILCNDFPPLNSIGAQRPFSWYRYLKQYGIEPVVITKNWKGHSSTPQDVLKNAGQEDVVKEVSEVGTIIRVPFIIQPPERMLLKHGENYKPVLRKFLTFIYRLLSFPISYFDVHRNIYKEARKILRQEHFDGIIATGEPFILFKYCYYLNKEFNIPWIADYRDGWKLNYVRNQQKGNLLKFMRWWEVFFENKYLRTASCITSIDPLLGGNLSSLHHKPLEVVYNGFDNFYSGAPGTVTPHPPLTLNHSGTITPEQRAEVLLQAVKELLEEGLIKEDEILIRFIGLAYFSDRNKRVLDFDSRVSKTIITTPRISREEVLKSNSEADYLITFSERRNKMLNAKTYDYLAVKRPILIIPNDESILSELVEKLHAGSSPRDVKELKVLLLNAIQQKRDGKTIPAPALTEKDALFYTREKQAMRLAEVMKKYFKE
jgi:hypothetical protein